MRLLLDENLPKRLKLDFQDHEIFTVHDRGWTSFKNGRLMELLVSNHFHVLLTFDKSLQHQQNFKKYPILVLTLTAWDNSYIRLRPLVPKIRAVLNQIPVPVGPIVISE